MQVPSKWTMFQNNCALAQVNKKVYVKKVIKNGILSVTMLCKENVYSGESNTGI